jgi:hypothetical protein
VQALKMAHTIGKPNPTHTKGYPVRIEVYPDQKAEGSDVCDADLSVSLFWAAPEQRGFTAKWETQQ